MIERAERRVTILGAGGTIAMTGPSATPELDADTLVGAVPAGFLSAQAARMKLLGCVGVGLSLDEVAQAFSQDDR